jgi:hypothetical protein
MAKSGSGDNKARAAHWWQDVSGERSESLDPQTHLDMAFAAQTGCQFESHQFARSLYWNPDRFNFE